MSDSKEVLHTQGEWYLENELPTTAGKKFYVFQINAGDGSDVGEYNTTKGIAEAIANAELIVKAVNNYQKLLDSNRELLEAAKNAIATLDRWQEHDNEAWDERDDATYDNLQTAINNAKNIK